MKVLKENTNVDAYDRFENFLQFINGHKDVNLRRMVNAEDIENYMTSDELNNFVDYLLDEYDLDESDIEEL